MSHGEPGNGKLAKTKDSDPELSDRKHAVAELPDGNDPLAGTGIRLTRYLKQTWSSGSPNSVTGDLYSKPKPSHFVFAGNGAPQ